MWDPDVERVTDLPPQGTAVTSIAISPDGTLFATGTEGGTVRLWDAISLRQFGQTYKLNDAGAGWRSGRTAGRWRSDRTTGRSLSGRCRDPAIGRPLHANGPVRHVTSATTARTSCVG